MTEIRVLRGAPTPEELAACVLVLQALAAGRAADRTTPGGPPTAVWPRTAAPLATPAPSWWASGRAGAWRA
ncbi:acyl-CoA carboxylase epsilon subunit [Streptomyces sp. NPDC048604]|uniref:acyl-CoA carboxylase epsilon subunit n=1 Tax=Streptomyces sp. NPDC048604 TaxID=3365578 RepID=UPI00371E102A